MRRAAYLFVILVILAVIAAGCTGSQSVQKTGTEPGSNTVSTPVANTIQPTAAAVSAKPTTLVLAAQWEPKTVDPHEYGYTGQRIGYTESLTGVDDQLNVIPSLSTSWKSSPDLKTWTFTLRDGVLFHDGTPFTADAMKKSLQRSLVKSKAFAAVPIIEIEAPDDKTLVVYLSKPFPALPAYLSKGEASALSASSWDVNGTLVKPVGTGPFIFDSWKPKEQITVVKNTRYWGQQATVDKVVYRIVPEAPTRGMLLKSGEAQISIILPPDIATGYMNNPDYTVQQQEIPRVRMLQFNNGRAPFNDKRVRQAVSYAIDRKAIITSVLEGIGSPGAGLFPTNSYWANKDIQPYPYDVEKARQLLAAAGWADANGDGILDKGGKPFTVTLVTYSERAELPPTAEVIQQQLKKVGIDMKIVVVTSSAMETLTKKGDYDMAIVGRGLLFTPDPDEIMMSDYYSPQAATTAYGVNKWSNTKVDQLIQDARSIQDPASRKEMYDEVQEIVVEDCPVLYLNYYVNLDVSTNKIQGYHSHPNEYAYHLEQVKFV